MSYQGNITLGDTIDIKFTTVNASGVPTTLAGTPAISAYPDNSTTQLTAGITLSVDFDAVTGLHNCRVVATGGNGYAAGNYALVITTGTVGGSSVVGYVIGSFSIDARLGDLSAASETQLDTIETRVTTALPNAAPDTASGLPTYGALTGIVLTGTVSDASPLAGDFDLSTDFDATANFYDGMYLVFSSGSLQGHGRKISAYTAARNASFTGAAGDADAPFPAAPANGDGVVLIGFHGA